MVRLSSLIGPISQPLFVNNSVDGIEPTHCSQIVGDVVPGVVVWSLCVYSHGWVGKCSEILAA